MKHVALIEALKLKPGESHGDYRRLSNGQLQRWFEGDDYYKGEWRDISDNGNVLRYF